MKKRTLALIVMFALVLTSVFALVACDNTVKYTVKFYDGTQKIKEVEVEDGKTVEDYKPTKDGYTFVAWYEDSSLEGDPFVMTTPIKADTKLFAKWQSTTVTADTRIWYVMGSVAEATWDPPTEKGEDGTWSIKDGMDSQIMTKAADKNEYTITLTVRAGQKFRFATELLDKNWTGEEGKAEAGLGSIVGFEYAAGINPESKSEVTLDSKEYGQVKSGNNVIFDGGKEYNANPKQWNIFLADGVEDGIYKFTLTTYPGEDDRDTLTYERTGDAPVLEVTHDMYIVGTIGSGEMWKDDYDAEDVIKLTKPTSGTIWKGRLTVTEDDCASWAAAQGPFGVPCASLKVKNKISNADYGIGASSGTVGSNNVFLLPGEYVITYDQATNAVSYEQLAYYVVGTMLDGTTPVNFAVKPGVTPLLGVKGDTVSAIIDIASVTSVSDYSWLAEKTLKGATAPGGAICAIKVVYGTSLDILTWYNAAEQTLSVPDENYYFATAGKYVVTLTPGEGAKFTVAPATANDEVVAKIGTAGYKTVASAIAAARNGDTVVLQKDVTCGGIAIWEADHISVELDLNNHTLTFGQAPVGSTGTESQGLHLEKGNAVTIKNGTITSVAESGVQMLIQNYCTLTLDGVTLDGSNLDGTGTAYTLSNNFGKVVVKGNSTIKARATKGVAFDLWYGMSAAYDDGITVTVEKGCTITGKIEYGAANRITDVKALEKVVLTLPAGEYTIEYLGIATKDNASITIAPAETPAD